MTPAVSKLLKPEKFDPLKLPEVPSLESADPEGFRALAAKRKRLADAASEWTRKLDEARGRFKRPDTDDAAARLLAGESVEIISKSEDSAAIEAAQAGLTVCLRAKCLCRDESDKVERAATEKILDDLAGWYTELCRQILAAGARLQALASVEQNFRVALAEQRVGAGRFPLNYPARPELLVICSPEGGRPSAIEAFAKAARDAGLDV